MTNDAEPVVCDVYHCGLAAGKEDPCDDACEKLTSCWGVGRGAECRSERLRWGVKTACFLALYLLLLLIQRGLDIGVGESDADCPDSPSP